MKPHSRYYGLAWRNTQYPAALIMGTIYFLLFINYVAVQQRTVAVQSLSMCGDTELYADGRFTLKSL